MHVLVTGGAGYIGSHTVVTLLNKDHEVTVVDNFSNSSPDVIDRIERITERRPAVHNTDLRDEEALRETLVSARPDAVIHFAGLKSVGESVEQPLHYYSHNLDTTFSLLRAMEAADVHRLVFSSSATVYGGGQQPPYREDEGTLASTNPYGQSKVMLERILTDVAAADDRWEVALLRYFNPIGAHASGLIGEDPRGIPNNLAPYIAQVAVGRRDHVTVFGDDYSTEDGTGERDYIHVVDLAEGHVAALEAIVGASGVQVWNLGTGTPTSVFGLIRAFERAVGSTIPVQIGPRRPGDLAQAWADTSKAATELGWRATRTVDDMATDSWRWQSQNPDGYASR